MARENSKITIILNIILVVLFLTYAGWELYRSINEHNKIEKELNNEYERLLLDDSISSKVLSTYYPEKWRGAKDIQYISFENRNQYLIWIRRNLTFKDICFGDIVKKGVFIKKRAGSDTLEVINGNDKYLYLISTIK